MTTSPRAPILHAGDRLTRDEFERRYAAMPDLKKAELIEGVVYMGSPVRLVQHGQPECDLSAWLGFYAVLTPGLSRGANSTVRLDLDNEPQPDLLLRIPETAGGASRVDIDGYVEGPPELVVEVAASSVSYDLHQKLHAYRRNGVLEYLVHRVDDGEVDWFVLERGAYARMQPDRDGLLKSRTFPGLWLDVQALLRGDLLALRSAVECGCSEPAHAAFVTRLRDSHPRAN
jgi:Uma2 family endonuclease